MKAPMRLLLLRHGQTDHNLAGRIQGQLPVPLNERGRAQARELALALRESLMRPQVLICSDLLRASQTAAILADLLEIPPPHLNPRWRARFLNLYQGFTRSELQANDTPGFLSWQQDPLHTAPPGGERGLDQQARVQQGLEDAHTLFTEGITVAAVVTHEGCLQAALRLVNVGCPEELGNGAVLELQRRGQTWVFSQLYPSLATLR
jgi:broad specificity phosphatase PhoE